MPRRPPGKAGSLPNWTTPGANGAGTDREAIASFNTLPSDVTAWYAVSAANHGWLIKANVLPPAGNNLVFASRENATFPDPALLITYIPKPTALALVTGSVLLCLRRRPA